MFAVSIALPERARSAYTGPSCVQMYKNSTQQLETLAAYHRSEASDRNILWKKATALDLELQPSSSACDLTTIRRYFVAQAVYFALAISNGTYPASKEDLDAAVGTLVTETNAKLGDYVPALSYTEQAGFDNTFMRWLVQRLVDLYHTNHYGMYDLSEDTIKGVRYWLPDFSLP
jgi:hypothetical protein